MTKNIFQDPFKELWVFLFKILKEYVRITTIKHDDGIMLKLGKVIFRILGVPLFLLVSPVVIIVIIIAFVAAL